MPTHRLPPGRPTQGVYLFLGIVAFYALITLLLVAFNVRATCPLPKSQWLPITSIHGQGACAWVSVKTLLAHHGWDRISERILDDVRREDVSGASTSSTVEARLKTYARNYGLQYSYQKQAFTWGPPGPDGACPCVRHRPTDAHLKFVRDSVDYGYGCLVTIHQSGHAVVCLDLTDDVMVYVDSNDVKDYQAGRTTTLQTRRLNARWWREHDWDGWAVCVYPKE